MAKNSTNIVMFPGWQESLEDKSVQLIQEKKFLEALHTIDQLIIHNAATFNTNMLKLLCHVELNQYDEAIEFCELVMKRHNPDYYTYLEFYLTILYQSNKFEEVIEIYEDEKKQGMIPVELEERLQELNRLSYQMLQQKKHSDSLAYLKELKKMISEGNIKGQWEFINGLRNIGAKPPEEIIQLLMNDQIHPVIKTTMFNWLKEYGIDDVVKIEKFGMKIKAKPKEIANISKHPILQETLMYLAEIEQENPSLYELIEELLIRYTYVKYPIFYTSEEAHNVAEALVYIGRKNLHLPVKNLDELNNKVNNFIREINKCNELYLTVLER